MLIYVNSSDTARACKHSCHFYYIFPPFVLSRDINIYKTTEIKLLFIHVHDPKSHFSHTAPILDHFVCGETHEHFLFIRDGLEDNVNSEMFSRDGLKYNVNTEM